MRQLALDVRTDWHGGTDSAIAPNATRLTWGQIQPALGVIARGVFTSVPDLKRKLMRYIHQYNKSPRTVKWKYFDPSRRISPESVVTVH